MKAIKVDLPDAIHGWLQCLVDIDVYGKDPKAVAERLILEGIARELRAPHGFLVARIRKLSRFEIQGGKRTRKRTR